MLLIINIFRYMLTWIILKTTLKRIDKINKYFYILNTTMVSLVLFWKSIICFFSSLNQNLLNIIVNPQKSGHATVK